MKKKLKNGPSKINSSGALENLRTTVVSVTCCWQDVIASAKLRLRLKTGIAISRQLKRKLLSPTWSNKLRTMNHFQAEMYVSKKNDKVNYSISMNQSSESAGLTLTPVYALQRWSQNLECKQGREIYRTDHSETPTSALTMFFFRGPLCSAWFCIH